MSEGRILMPLDDLQKQVASRIQERNIGLRLVEAESGVSFSTVSRFIRGHGILTFTNHEKLTDWLCGINGPKKKVVSTKRMKVGSKIFLVTIEELLLK